MKWKVLHIIERIDSGGVERRRLSLAKWLDKDRFELKIVCSKASSKIADEIIDNGVELYEVGDLKSPFNLAVHFKVLKIVKEYKPHIVHGAVFEGVTLAAISGFIMRVPCVIIEETSEPSTRSWRANMLMMLFGRLSHLAIGVSEASKSYLINKAKIPQNKVKLVVNGVNLNRNVTDISHEEFKKELGIKKHGLVIGSVGRMVDSVKKFSRLIEVMAIIKRENPDVYLILVGDGPDLSMLKRLASDLDVVDRVIFTGFQDSPDKFYSIFDLFSLLSEREAFGLVLVEAMIHKLPVVATNVGGIPSIVRDGETGFLVDKLDNKEVVEKIVHLLNDNKLRKKMGQRGYDLAVNSFGEERYVGDLESLYDSFLSNKE